MRATVKKINQMLRYCDAVSEEHVLFIFRPPQSGLNTGDVIEFDAEILEEPQTATDLSTGGTFIIELFSHNVHDLRLRGVEIPEPISSPENLKTA